MKNRGDIAVSLLAGALLLLLGATSARGQCLNCASAVTVDSANSVSMTVDNTVDHAAPASISNGYFKATISGSSSSSALPNGTVPVWCGDFQSAAVRLTGSSYTPYSSYSSNLPPGTANPAWPKINYVLNHQQGTVQDVQRAIWILLTGTTDLPPTTASEAMIAAANANPSFAPASGQYLAVALRADGIAPPASAYSRQDLIAAVRVPDCGTLGDYVWNDANGDGIQTPDETGVDGVTVRLLNQSGTVLASTTTGPRLGQSGYYQFRNLACGPTYQVQVDTTSGPLAGKSASPLNGTADTTRDSNLNPSAVVIPPSGSDQTIDFGFYTPAPCTGEIGDFVFNDTNANGIQDVVDNGIGGVRVLLSGPGGLNAFAVTDGNGGYRFTGLCSGTYTVSVDAATVPPTFMATFVSAAGSNPGTDSNPIPSTVVLPTSSSSDRTIDFGYHAPCDSIIGDVVWADLNGNGIQDANEPGINGVTLQLLNPLTGVAGTATTTQMGGVNGSYLFTGLCSGPYTVLVTGGIPADYTPSPTGASGSTAANDSNGSPATLLLPLSTTDRTIDFGYIPPCTGSIGDFVWNDSNANGIQDSGEAALAGVTVNLRKSSDNSLLQTTISSAGPGPNYRFTGLCTGDYRVEVVRPAGYVASRTGAGSASTDSNPNPAPVSLPANNAADARIDFGFYGLPAASCTLVSAVQGMPLTGVVLAASGGAGAAYSFTATGLPSALSVSTQGEVSGTPGITGTFRYTITVADQLGNIGSKDCALTVVPPIVSNCVVIRAVQGVPITPVPLPASGGAGGPYTFTATGLPRGLTVSLSGMISGTPEVSGTFPYSVTIRDSAGNAGTLNCAVTVVTRPATSCVLITATQYVPVTPVQLTGSGGAGGPYTFRASGLPAGVSVSASGLISGAPQVSGTFRYTVTVRDKDGNEGTSDCSVTVGVVPPLSACVAGPAGVNLGGLQNFLFYFANGSTDANWQGASKGFAGNVLVHGISAAERTSGTVPYAGTLYTNDRTAGAWQKIINDNAGQAAAGTGQVTVQAAMEAALRNAFAEINAMPVTPGYESRSASSLDGLNTQNGVAERIVINVTSGFGISGKIGICGDAGDTFVLRWDTDANFANGYQGQVKFQSGGAIVPGCGLTAANFVHVAGDITASGGGSTPPPPYPQGPRLSNGTGSLIAGGHDFTGGGFFTGYWLTTGNEKGETASMSNAIFVGGWYSLTKKFSMTSGTSGVQVCPR